MLYLMTGKFHRSFMYFLGDSSDVTGSQPAVARVSVEPGSSLSVATTSPDRVPYPSENDNKPATDYLGKDQVPVIHSSEVCTAYGVGRCQLKNSRAGPLSTAATGGFFPNGNGFNFYKPVMKEVHEHHSPGVLQELVKYIIPGAEFDSLYRDDPPRCHPDTRTGFLEQLQTRIYDSILATRIVWLVGPAGVGKSAIMQSLAEIVCPFPTIRCATLFFSRPNHRDDPRKAFATLAYSFALADPEYRRYIGEKLAVDPTFLDKSLDEQFKRLFVAPFTTRSVNVGSRHWVVLVDGLDECSGEREQCRIVELIRESISHHAQTTPFIWIIASRPEVHLQASFRRVEQQTTCFWKLEVPINSEEALRSVELYLRTEFAKIGHNYADVVPSLWPSETDFLRLTKASSGLFVFASILVDYVGKEDPVLRLKYILYRTGQSNVDRYGRAHGMRTNPFHPLDVLYMTIMSDVPPDSLPTTKTILASYLLGDLVLVRNWNLLQLCNILGLEQHDTYAALRKLHSVLTFPSPGEACEKPVQFLHDSFPDFLMNRSRSQSYYVDLDQELRNIWRCYVNILKSTLEDHITLSWEPPSVNQKFEVHDIIAKEAQFQWLRILVRFCHDPSCQHGMEHRLSLDTSELVVAFEKLSTTFFECMKSHVGSFCGWLSSHAPVAFRQKIIFKELDVTELTEHDLDNMFTGLCIRRWGCLIYSPALAVFDLADLNADRWDQAKQQVLNHPNNTFWGDKNRPVSWSVLANLLRPQKTLEMTRPRGVMIIRLGPVEYYAIIGPLAIRSYRAGRKINYLVFPYHIASNDSPPPHIADPS